jgi:hypothetical protein
MFHTRKLITTLYTGLFFSILILSGQPAEARKKHVWHFPAVQTEVPFSIFPMPSLHVFPVHIKTWNFPIWLRLVQSKTCAG